MKILFCNVLIFICVCGNKQKTPNTNRTFIEEIKESTLTDSGFNQLLLKKKPNKNQIVEIVNDTTMKGTYRLLALYHLVEKCFYNNISINKIKGCLSFSGWLKRNNLRILDWYSGPPSDDTTDGLPSFFENYGMSGIVVAITPEFHQVRDSRICFKIGVESKYKGKPITEDLLFKYLTENYNDPNIDELPIIKMRIFRNYWH